MSPRSRIQRPHSDAGRLPDLAIDVKIAWLGRDNGTYEDAAIKKVLSRQVGL
jgi:hypothetical protein